MGLGRDRKGATTYNKSNTSRQTIVEHKVRLNCFLPLTSKKQYGLVCTCVCSLMYVYMYVFMYVCMYVRTSSHHFSQKMHASIYMCCPTCLHYTPECPVEQKEKPFQNTPTTKTKTAHRLVRHRMRCSRQTKRNRQLRQQLYATRVLCPTVVVLSPEAAEGLVQCPTNRRSTRVHFPNYVHTIPQLCAHQLTPRESRPPGCL